MKIRTDDVTDAGSRFLPAWKKNAADFTGNHTGLGD